MYTSLIITTYNWPDALKITLDSVKKQSADCFEIIIADDGSAPETADVVKETLKSTVIPWCHVRHDDNGIRQARIKNLAVRYSHGSYLILIDHDVVLHPEFIKEHLSRAKKNVFLQGKRVFLSEKTTKSFIDSDFKKKIYPWSKGIYNRKNAIHMPQIGKMLSRTKGFQVTLRGCNLSMHKDDFIKVDGYDETFDSLWGREDSDICYRLFNSGVKMNNLLFSALQYHLHHNTIKKNIRDALDDELDQIIKEKRTRSKKGYSKMSSEGEIISTSSNFN